MRSAPRPVLLACALALVTLALPQTSARVAAQSGDSHPSATWRVVHADGRFDRSITLKQLAAPDREWFIAGSDLADALQVGRFWRVDVRKLVLRVDDQRITFTVGARSVVAGEEALLLRHEVAYHRGEPWIPLEFLDSALGEFTERAVEIDAKNNRITLGRRSVSVTGFDVVRGDGASTELRIRLRSPLAFRVDDSRMRNLVVKIYGGVLDPAAFTLEAPRGLVDAVRGQQLDDHALVEVDLSELAVRFSSHTADGGATIVLRIEEAPVSLIPDPVPRGPHLVQTLAPEARGREVNVRRVVIDPGHGGDDVGAIGANRLLEKDVTLAIARELERILEREHDIDAVLTRTDEGSIGLVERTEAANRAGGDLLISLHCNAWSHASANGVETYFASPTKSGWDASVARSENSSVSAAEDLDFIQWDLVQNVYIQESATLAEIVQGRLSDDLGLRNRGVKQAGLRVLAGAFMPAILVELGFVTHRDDAAKLGDPRWQRQAAASLADAVVEFRARMDALREQSR